MAIKIKVQKDYLKTEASIELPANVGQVDDLLRAMKTSGKMVVLYYEGSIQGINVEQNTKIDSGQSKDIRTRLGIEDKPL